MVALVAASAVHFVNQGQIARDDFDACSDTVAVCLGSAEANLQPMIARRAVVAEHGGPAARVEDDEVEIAVVVQIVEPPLRGC